MKTSGTIKIGDELGGGRVLFRSSFFRKENREEIHYFITVTIEGKYLLYYSLGIGNPINRIASFKKIKNAYKKLFEELRLEALLTFNKHDLANPWKSI